MYLLAVAKNLMLLPALVAWFALIRTCRQARVELPGWSRWLGLQVCLATVVEGLGRLTSVWHVTNVVGYNAYMVAEFALLSAALVEVDGRSARVRREVWIGGALFAVAFVLDGWSDGMQVRFLTNALLIGGFLLAVQAALGLYRLVEVGVEPLHHRPAFWALLSIVLYSLAATPVFGLYNYLMKHNTELAFKVYAINDVLFVLRYGLVAYSFLLARSRYAKDR